MASLVTPGNTIATTVAVAQEENRIDPFAGRSDDQLMTPGEVAKVMRVDAKTVTRWAAAGKIASVRTLGGHRRFFVRDLRAMIKED